MNPDPVDEARLSILKLKQRFSSNQSGTELVDRVAVLTQPRFKPNYGTLDVGSLRDDVQLACRIADLAHVAEYQSQSMQSILDGRNVLLSAPAGFGKTEAFLLPLLVQAVRKNKVVILTYPRLELARDQLSRALRLTKRTHELLGTRPRIGIQVEGVGAIIRHTLQIDKREGLTRAAPDDSNDVATISWHSTDRDSVILDIVPTCPICSNGQLRASAWYRLRDAGRTRGAFYELSKFQCSNEHCRTEYDLSLSKEDHVSSPPHLLVTTLESLDNMLLNPEFESLWGNVLGLVTDEIHAYHSLYGSHTANIVRRFQDRVRSRARASPILVGSSATIDAPQEFGRTFFGTDNIDVVIPGERDKLPSSREIYYFVRSKEGRELEVYLQLAMLAGHSLLRGGTRGLFFFDSLDLLFRATKQLEDADGDRRLWEFRLYKESDPRHNWDRTFPCPHRRTREGCQYLNCTTRNEGECWWYHPTMIRRQGDPLDRELTIESVSSWDRGYDREHTRLVNATSSLELGINDPRIACIGQYKSPRTVFSFIQRVGRGGRAEGQDVEVFVIMGFDITDVFYFRRRDKIVRGSFKLPLNPANPFVRKLHDELERISAKVRETVPRVAQRQPEDAADYPYRVKCEASWDGALASFDSGFRQELEGTLGAGFTRALSLHRGKKEEIVRKVEDRIGSLKAEIAQEVRELSRVVGPITEPIDAIANLRTPFLELLQEPRIQGNEPLVASVSDAVQQISDLYSAVDSEAEPQVVADGVLHLADFVGQLYPNLVRLGVARELVSRVTTTVQEVADLFRGPRAAVDIVASQRRVRKLRDKIAMYERVDKAVWFWDPAQIIKSLYRAYFYYCRWSDFPVRPVYLPEAYFDEFENVTLRLFDETDALREQRQASLANVFYSYIPWKTTYVQESLLSPRFSTDEVRKIQGMPTQILLTPKVEGKKDLLGTREVLVPTSVDVNLLPIDPRVKSIITLCPVCYAVYGFGEDHCRLDGQRTRPGRLYSSPVVDRSFSVTDANGSPQVYGRTEKLTLADITSWIVLRGVECTFRPYRYLSQTGDWVPAGGEEDIRGDYRLPIAINLLTRGIVFRPPPLTDIIDTGLLGELGARGVDPSEAYLHSAAHLLVLLVASISGVNPEILWYGYDTESGEVGVWERYEGGAGIVDAFFSRLLTAPHEVYAELQRITRCPTNDAEDCVLGNRPEASLSEEARAELDVIERTTPRQSAEQIFRESHNLWGTLDRTADHAQIHQALADGVANRLGIGVDAVREALPFHLFDGCPQCLWVPYCSKGKLEQWRYVSLRLMRRLVDSLTRKTRSRDEAASVILDPTQGFVVSEENGEFVILRL